MKKNMKQDSITQDETLTSLCEHVEKVMDFLVNIDNLGKLGSNGELGRTVRLTTIDLI